MSTDPGPGLKNAVVYWATLIIVILAVIGVAYVIINVMGVPIPVWLQTILGIGAAAFVGILVIKFIVKQAP